MTSTLSRGQYVRLLSAVYVATFIIRVAFGIVLVTFAAYLKETSNFYYGLLAGASPLLELLAVIVLGPFIDEHGGKRVLVWGLILGAVSLLGLATTTNLLVLGSFNGLHGLAAAMILVPTLAIIADVAPESHRGREMGTFNFVNMFGWFGGFAAGYVMLEIFAADLRGTFVVAGLLALGGAAYAWFNIKEEWRGLKDPGHVDMTTLPRVLKRLDVLLLGGPWFIVFLFLASLVTFQSRALGTSGASGFATALGVAALGLVFVATQIVYGQLADRYGRDPLMLAGAIGFVGLMLVVAYAAAGVGGDVADLWLRLLTLWPLLALFTLMMLAFPPAGLAALADVAENLPTGVTMGVYTMSLALGFTLGPPIAGVVSDHWQTPGVVTFFLALSILFLLLVMMRSFRVTVEQLRSQMV